MTLGIDPAEGHGDSEHPGAEASQQTNQDAPAATGDAAPPGATGEEAPARAPRRRRAASRAAGPPPAPEAGDDTPPESAASPTGDAPKPDAPQPDAPQPDALQPEAARPAKRAPRKRATKKTAAATSTAEVDAAAQDADTQAPPPSAAQPTDSDAVAEPAPPRKRATRKRATARTAKATAEPTPDAVAHPGMQAVDGDAQASTTEDPTPPDVAVEVSESPQAAADEPADEEPADETPVEDTAADAISSDDETSQDVPPAEPASSAPSGVALLFQPPDLEAAPRRRRRAASRPAGPPVVSPHEPDEAAGDPDAASPPTDQASATAPGTSTDSSRTDSSRTDSSRPETDDETDDDDIDDGKPRRRRRGGRGRRRRGPDPAEATDTETDPGADGTAADATRAAETDADGDRAAATDTGDTQSGTADGPADRTPGTGDEPGDAATDAADTGGDEEDEESGGGTRRRRRRRRRGGSDGDAAAGPSDPPDTVVRVRQPRKSSEKSQDRGGDRGQDKSHDEVTGVKGSTRLEAKRQRRRDGRDSGRRRPIITESEFLARREAVDRTMVVREHAGRTQIVVLEDGVLVEHYVARKAAASVLGNVYLGKVQNVLPSMEAAFVDIGKGRNAVLYAGEVNWDAAGMQGQPRRIELALKSGDSVLVQVSKDPVGTKGARLTSQISLPGRYLVYVPNSSMTGISRKLPDTERSRLKAILKKVVPADGGVIVRTASEGASEAELERDVNRLVAQWEDIQKRAKGASAPSVLHSEPDLTLKVVRDVFNEDYTSLVVAGDEVWSTVREYVDAVAPDLAPRLRKWDGEGDVFAAHRVDEQIAKGLERKVWLPSGGSLVIDRTEAMTVVDVNTGKFVGSGGNLEETVTRNNLEAAEELVRQLRLRDVGGIIVVDFIDMVLEVNRDLVLRRLMECLGRDRTKHQVAEVTSLGLVQMTRKRVGQGLLEAFSEPCEACQGSGVILHSEPVERADRGNGSDQRSQPAPEPRRGASEASKVAEAARKAKEKAEAARREAESVGDDAVVPASSDVAAPLPEQVAADLTDAEPVVAEAVGQPSTEGGPDGVEPAVEPRDLEPVDVDPVAIDPVVVVPDPDERPDERPADMTDVAAGPADEQGEPEGSGAVASEPVEPQPLSEPVVAAVTEPRSAVLADLEALSWPATSPSPHASAPDGPDGDADAAAATPPKRRRRRATSPVTAPSSSTPGGAV